MDMNQVKDVLLWGIGINYAFLLFWFGLFVFAHDGLYRMHTRWFRLSPDVFDALNYGGMGLYKIGILLLFVGPLIAVCYS